MVDQRAGRRRAAEHDLEHVGREDGAEDVRQGQPRGGGRASGFRIVALPKARLGAAFQSGIAIGKFHGVSSAVTPTGTWRAISSWSAAAAGIVSPSGSSAACA